MLIIAPTGGGKSTVINFCISQFQRYGNVRTIIFDRNRSCEASTKLHGGQHIDIKKVGVKLNPFAMMRDGTPDGQLFVREYLLRRLSDGGFVATSDERNEIDEALTKLNKSGEPVSMTRFAVQISKRLESQFSEWLDGGPYGMFDNEKDGMTLEDWTTIEMSSVMAHERLARAFIDLLFRKIICSLDGRPTLIYIEEASFLINNPLFAPLIDEWLKAVRGRGGFIWMTIQSPTSVTSAEMASSILDNIFSFMLLYNKKVESHRADYRSKLGLDDHQIDMVAKLQPKRDYLLIQDGVSRVMTTHFTPEVLAYLRSEKAAMNIFDQLEEEGKEGWQTEYLARVGKFN
jgi:type IV secretion system protein VirB4